VSTESQGHELPRELAPGLFWLGACLTLPHEGRVLHAYNSVYLLSGTDASMLIEGGHPQDLHIIEKQLEGLLRKGVPPLRYAFLTHTETPHASGLGRILSHFPEVEAYGAMVDIPLVFPELADRVHNLDPGERLDLGGSEFIAVDAVIRDMPYTRWGFDTRRRALFPGDGFAYAHYHEAGQCGCLAEETPGLALSDMTALFADVALYWTRFADLEPYCARLDSLLDERGVELVAPTHGLPIGDVATTMPLVREGLLMGSRRARQQGVF
jgi:flavorubredoxin